MNNYQVLFIKDGFDRPWDNKKLLSPDPRSQIIVAWFLGTLRWRRERSKDGLVSCGFILPNQGIFPKKKWASSKPLAEMGALAIENPGMYEQLRKDYENLVSDILMFVRYWRSI
jgi:hypothetical protein